LNRNLNLDEQAIMDVIVGEVENKMSFYNNKFEALEKRR